MIRPRRQQPQQDGVDVRQQTATDSHRTPLTHRGIPLCVRGINSAAVLRITLTRL